LSHPLRALKHRNFRLLWLGLFAANMGTLIQFVAQDYLVFSLTHEAFWLGVVDAAGAVTLILTSMWGGALVDRWPKRRTLLVTQSLFLLSPLAVGLLISSGRIQVWHVVAFSVFTMLVLAVDYPARQALLPRLVPRKSFLNAVALNSVSFTGASAIGPALAGPIIAHWGTAAGFYLDAASSLAVLSALVLVRLDREGAPERADGGLHERVLEGFRYVVRTRELFLLGLLLAVVSFFAYPYQTLLPIFTSNVLHGDVVAFGLLRAAPGVGALVGGLVVGSMEERSLQARRMAMGAVGFTLCLLAFVSFPSLWLDLALLALAGALFTLFQATLQTFMQLRARDAMRGRVMSLFALAVIGVGPLGSFPIAWLADRVGVRVAVGAAAVVAGAFCAAVWAFQHRVLRRLEARCDEERRSSSARGSLRASG
jgi:MFS family permease